MRLPKLPSTAAVELGVVPARQPAGWGATTWAYAVLLGLLVVSVSAIPFLPVLSNGFVAWDDHQNFLRNEGFRGLGREQLRWAWTTYLMGVYQPLGWMILEAEYGAWGLEPWGYHLVSLLIHAANAGVLYALTAALILRAYPRVAAGRPGPVLRTAAMAAILFAVHPLRAEVVAWVSAQSYLPSIFLFMLALLAYLGAHPEGGPTRTRWNIAALLLFVAALLCKAVAVSLPVVLLILDVSPLRRLGGGRNWFGAAARRVWVEKLPFAAVGLIGIAFAVRARRYDGVIVSLQEVGLTSRLAQAGYGACFTIVKTVLPRGLSAYYPRPDPISWNELPFLASLTAVGAISAALILARRRWPGLLAAWAGYLVMLAPSAGFVQIRYQLVGDRYSYLASLAVVPVLASGLGRLGRSRRMALLRAGVVSVAIASLSVLTWRQCATWHDSESLWRHVVRHVGSDSVLARNNLGFALAERGWVEEALAQFAEAQRIDPHNPDVHRNLGKALGLQGRLSESVAQYAEAVRLRPGDPSLRNELGLALLQRGKAREAADCLAEAVRLEPGHVEARNSLGIALARLGKPEEAIGQLTEAVRLEPRHAKAHNNLGLAWAQLGKPREAAACFAEAVRLEPRWADAHCNLATSLIQQGKRGEAMEEFAHTLLLQPGHSGARRGMDDLRARLRPVPRG